MSSRCLLVSVTAGKNSTVNPIVVPLCMMSFSLSASRFSISFGFRYLYSIVHGCGSLHLSYLEFLGCVENDFPLI